MIKRLAPFGVILFKRNISSFFQLEKLIKKIRDASEFQISFFIDQEGGKVQRLLGKDWALFPPANIFGEIAKKSIKQAMEAVKLNYSLIADDLNQLGINVNCVPCVDLYNPDANEVIGSRSFSEDPFIVSALGKKSCEAMLSQKIFPVIKHIPGHGRANEDSHEKLPYIEEDISVLDESDFIPFKELQNMPFAMTAHILFKNIDNVKPISYSHLSHQFIRNKLQYKGILISDDINMSALSGRIEQRVDKVASAGFDLILYCEGNIINNQKVLEVAPDLGQAVIKKWGKYKKQYSSVKSFDRKNYNYRLKHLLKNYFDYDYS